MQKWYKAVSLFNIISPTLNASPPALTKCINSFRKNSFGSPRNHSCTAWRTSSSERNFFLPVASWSCCGSTVWKSLGASSGEYGGWGRHSKCRSVIAATVVRQCGALHCHVAKGHLMTAIHVALIWLQAKDNFLGDLSMMLWWQWPL